MVEYFLPKMQIEMKVIRKVWFWFVVVSAVVAMVLGQRACKRGNQVLDARRVSRVVQVDSVRYWRDLYGREHATRMVAEGDRRTLELFYAGKLDSARKELGLNKRQLKGHTEIETQAQGGGSVPVTTVVVHDTVNGVVYMDTVRRVIYVDSVGQDTLAVVTASIGADSADVTYKVWVTLKKRDYWRRKWFMGRKRWYTDVSSTNPRVKVKGLESLRIR